MNGYHDYFSDAVFFLLLVASAFGVIYLLAQLFGVDLWRFV